MLLAALCAQFQLCYITSQDKVSIRLICYLLLSIKLTLDLTGKTTSDKKGVLTPDSQEREKETSWK